MKVPYTYFDKVIIRTPAFSLRKSNEVIVQSEEFKDAIYFASPELFELWESEQIAEGRKNTLRKYCIRSKSRCTPFGLFSACSVCSIKNTKTDLVFKKALDRGHLKLDYTALSYLHSSIDYTKICENNPIVFINSSAYRIGSEIRYVYYSIDEKAQRHYSLSSFELDENILRIIELIHRGNTKFNDIVNVLVNDGFSDEEAEKYIIELLNAKVLISQAELSTIILPTDNQPLQSLEPFFVDTPLYNDLLSFLKQNEANVPGKMRSVAKQISNIITSRFPDISPKCILQVDMYREFIGSALSSSIVEDIISTIPVMVQYSNLEGNVENKRLEKFKEDFTKRYDKQRMPLLQVLDPDYGIGYDTDLFCWESSGLLNDLPFNFSHIKSSNFHKDSLRYNITICDEPQLGTLDVASIDWSKFPETMAIFCSLFKDTDGEIIINIRNIGGVSALNTITRFSHLSNDIYNLVKSIADFEQKQAPNNSLNSYIDIIPNIRSGNVMRHFDVRNQVISFPNQTPNSIPLNQLYVSVEANRIVVTDKNECEIRPCIDNALMYDYANLSIYKFLCDIQSQNTFCSLLKHSFVSESISYIPRISYGNIIIHRAEWKIRKDISIIDATKLFEYLEKLNIPNNCTVIDGDNELRIDYFNEKDLSILFSYFKRCNEYIVIYEDLLSQYDCLVRDEDGLPYSNEIIIPIHKIYD